MNSKLLITILMLGMCVAACSKNEPIDDRVGEDHNYMTDTFSFNSNGDCQNALKARFDDETLKNKVLGHAWDDTYAYSIDKTTGKVDGSQTYWSKVTGTGSMTIFLNKDKNSGTDYFSGGGYNFSKDFECTYNYTYHSMTYLRNDKQTFPPHLQFLKYEETSQGTFLWAVENYGYSGSVGEPKYEFLLVKLRMLSDKEYDDIKAKVNTKL